MFKCFNVIIELPLLKSLEGVLNNCTAGEIPNRMPLSKLVTRGEELRN